MPILFDIDDTLLDDSRAVSAGVAVLYCAMQPSNPIDEFRALWTESQERSFADYLAGQITFQEQRRARIREVAARAISDAEADQLFSIYLTGYESAWALFPDVLPCLNQLSGYRLGVLTNGDAVQQRAKLWRTGIASRFECVVISSECGAAKPSREIFQYACGLLDVEASRVVYVGDQFGLDAQPARDAGLVGVWLDRGQLRRREAAPVITNLKELSAVLANGSCSA